MREPIDSFLNYLAVEKGYSGHTIDAYRNDLNGLTEFASGRGLQAGLGAFLV